MDRWLRAISAFAGPATNVLGFGVDLIETRCPGDATEIASARRRDGRRLTATLPVWRRQPRHRQLRHRSGLVIMPGAQVTSVPLRSTRQPDDRFDCVPLAER